jgi:hypothetical protein
MHKTAEPIRMTVFTIVANALENSAAKAPETAATYASLDATAQRYSN